MAHLPPDSYHYSVLSDYYNQLSLHEKLEACNKLQKIRSHEPPLPTDSAFHFPNRYPLNLSHYSPVNEVYSPHPSSYSKVHPKKKIRMAYDKEIADSTSKRGFVPYPSISRHNEATNFTPTYAETSKSHLNIPKPPEASCPQTKISEEMESHGELPKLIPLYSEPPVPFPSPLTPCNSPGSTHEFPYSPVEDIKPISAHSNSGWTSSSSQSELDPYNEKPQDLRVSFSERLKDVARDILTASSIPQLNCSEIPELVALNPDPVKDDKTPTAVGKHGIFDESEKRMSRESSSHSPTHHHSIKASSPKCDNSCSSCYNPSPSSSTSKCSQSSQSASSSKDSKWTGKQKSSNSRTQFERYEKSPSTSVSQSDKIEDPEAYLRKPIVEWSYADVIFFLMDACKELHINPGDVKFKRSDNGSVLLQMTPNDFEVLAPNHGQRLYDYFVNFQTQHYMSTNSRNIPHRYNGNYSEDQGNYSRQEHVHPSHHQSYTSNNLYPHPYDPPEAHSNSSGHYDQYPSSPCHSSFPGESPANEYIPQGSQYSEHNHSSQSSEEMRQRKSYELPSAAWKIFPPLHNYEDPLSDPDEFEDEPPPVEPPKKRGPGRPPKPESERKRRPKKTGRLWEFIRNLLLDPKTCPSLLRWEDAHAGIFRIVQSDAIANKWGMRKNNEKMNYEKLSRAMRYYYKAKIFEPVLGKRLVYKFGINAKGWRPLNPNNPNFQNY